MQRHPPQLVDLLDPRQNPNPPVVDSVNIPAAELADRVFELPEKARSLRVARLEGSAEALFWLTESGRLAAVTDDFIFGRSEPRRLWRPNEFLEEVAPQLPVGVALDLGCGTGRDAVHLASLGWKVYGVDHLPDALVRARLLEARYLESKRIKWTLADLAEGLPDFGIRFDLITLFFHFDLALVAGAIGLLEPGGSLLIESFSEEHRLAFGKPKEARRTIGKDLKDVLGALDLKVWTEHEREGRHTVRVWAMSASR